LNSPRLIPVVSLVGDEAVKTKSFKDPIYVGDPVNTVSLFSSFEAEELIVLDISRSFNSNPTSNQTLERIVESAYMPIAYGGGIYDLDIAERMFSIGFDKVVIRKELLNVSLAEEVARKYGSQAVTGCIDLSYSNDNSDKIEVNGVIIDNTSVEFLIDRIRKSRIGELIIHDKDREGSRCGLRTNWLSAMVQLGGCSSVIDAAKFVKNTGFHSVAASSIFLFRPTRDAVLINYPETEDWLNYLENGDLEQ
jgi:cyclase